MNPYVITIYVASFIAVIAIWLIIRKRAPLKPKDLEVKSKSFLFGIKNIRNWSDELINDLRFLSTWGKWRYKTPWILMLGQSGSGKSSVAESVSSGRRQDLLLKERILTSRGDINWHFFNGGVLIDPHQLKVGSSGGDANIALSCAKTLGRLNDLRPERPLDGVVLTIPAKVLLLGDAQEIQLLAERSYQQLWAIQKQFEFSFPVYVLVTQCDEVEGFDVFWKSQSGPHLNDMFGWSSPYSLDTGFSSEWVNEAFTSMVDALKVLLLETTATDHIDQLVAANENLEDKFFLYPRRFRKLQKPLRIVLKYVLRPSAYHANFYFRGMYFSGAIQNENENKYEETEVRKDVRFLNRFFDEKVFIERNLAEPTRSGVWSRKKQIRIAQYISVAIFAILSWVLWDTTGLITKQKTQFLNSVKLIRQDSNTLSPNNCPSYDKVYKLLDSIAPLKTDWTYAAIPLSWGENKKISTASIDFLADSAFEKVVFPSLHCHLQSRSEIIKENKILTPTTGTASHVISQMKKDMVNYAESILDLERNYKIFIHLHDDTTLDKVNESLANLEKLTKYLYDRDLPKSVYNKNSHLLSSLAEVDVDFYETEQKKKAFLTAKEKFRQTVIDTLAMMAEQISQERDTQMSLGPALLKTIDTGKAKLLTDTLHLTGWLQWVKAEWLNNRNSQTPCDETYAELDPIISILKEKFGYSNILKRVQTSFTSKTCSRKNFAILDNVSIAPSPSLVSYSDGNRQMSDSAIQELSGLKNLLLLDFMQLPTKGDFECRIPLRGWNPQQLAKASAYIREYMEFADSTGVDKVAASERPLYDRIAREQLVRVLDSVMQDAQILSDIDSNPLSNVATSLDSEMRKGSRDFKDALPQLLFILSKYQSLGFDNSLHRIRQCTHDYTTDSLTNIDSLSDLSRLYQPSYVGEKPSFVGDTKSAVDIAFYNLGTVPKTKAYLDQQFHRARILGGYAKPFVRFLRNSKTLDNTVIPNKQIFDYWQQTLTQITQKQQFATPTSQPAFLDDLFVNELQPMTDGNCNDLLSKQKPPAIGNDLFSDRREFLLQQSWLYCEDYYKAESFTKYSKFAKYFNRSLQGQFPFSKQYDHEATISSVRNMLMNYIAGGEDIKGYSKHLSEDKKDNLPAYLEKMDAVAEFMASNLAAKEPQPVTLNISFRARHKNSDGSDQLVNWRLSNGHKEINFPPYQQGNSMQMQWRYGQPLILELDWATLSNFTPVLDKEQPDMKVDGKKVTFKVEGNWALFKWLQLHTPSSGPAKDANTEPEKHYLEFSVPVKNMVLGNDLTKSPVYLYLAISASGIDAKTKKQVAINIPTNFPQSAPIDW